MSTSSLTSTLLGAKSRGLILLTAGIGITGATGAALSTDYRAYLALEGQLHFAETTADSAREAYCEAREQTDHDHLPADEKGCPSEDSPEPDSSEPSDSDALSQWEERTKVVNEAAAFEVIQPGHLMTLRTGWINDWRATIQPLKDVEMAQVVDPKTRVRQWFQAHGGFFGMGLFLVLWGAWTSRKALREELSSAPDERSGPQSGAVDFGQLLDLVVEEARSIQSQMNALKKPNVSDLDALQIRLERLQKEELTRLLSAGPRLQMKYGITAFASIFSPLAGGERRLNRLWSTLVDRHWPESLASIDAAVVQLEASQAAWSDTLQAA